MSWHFSRALVAEYLEATSLDGDAFAPSNGNPIPQAYLSPDRMKAFSRLSRFGMTCEPLTGTLGVDLLTWYLGGFPVRTLAQPEKEKELKVSEAVCGKKWHGSLAKYDRDMSSWKTVQGSLFEDLEGYLATFPSWGMMRNGELSARGTLGRNTSETDSSYLDLHPTPCAQERGGKQTPRSTLSLWKWVNGWRKNGTKVHDDIGPLNPELSELVMGFPVGWSDLERSVMPSFRQWSALHGIPFTPELKHA